MKLSARESWVVVLEWVVGRRSCVLLFTVALVFGARLLVPT
jgi:hypothetical protein